MRYNGTWQSQETLGVWGEQCVEECWVWGLGRVIADFPVAVFSHHIQKTLSASRISVAKHKYMWKGVPLAHVTQWRLVYLPLSSPSCSSESQPRWAAQDWALWSCSEHQPCQISCELRVVFIQQFSHFNSCSSVCPVLSWKMWEVGSVWPGPYLWHLLTLSLPVLPSLLLLLAGWLLSWF